MYNASANDLERVASDLDRIAQKYQAGSEELDQYVITLEGATSHLLSGAVQQWRGISSEAFLSAWLERKARLQQASMLMSESIGYLQRLSRTIEDNLPAIRADQNMLSQTIFSTLGADAQASIMNEESQAQNTVFMAIAALNSQLEQLIEEVNDCPEADQEGPFPGFGDNISRNDVGKGDESGESGDGTSGIPASTGSPGGYINENPDATPDEQKVGEFLGENLPETTVKGLAEVPGKPSPDYEFTYPDGSVHKGDLYQPATTNANNIYSTIMNKAARQGDTVVVELGQGVNGTGESYKLGIDEAQGISDSVFNDSTRINRIIFVKKDITTGKLSIFLDISRP